MNRCIAAVAILVLFAYAAGRVVALNVPAEVGDVSAAAGTKPELTARLVDADKKALKKTATVEVLVRGVKLVDPDSVNAKAATGQGHLHYRLDSVAVIATTATKLSFHDLSSGTHSITVALAANDHSPLGPTQTMSLNVP